MAPREIRGTPSRRRWTVRGRVCFGSDLPCAAGCRGCGKVGILLLDFHFSIIPTKRFFLPGFQFVIPVAAGAVGMWESRRLCEISKGLVGRVGSPLLAFHAFHRPGISTAPSGPLVAPTTARAISRAPSDRPRSVDGCYHQTAGDAPHRIASHRPTSPATEPKIVPIHSDLKVLREHNVSS